MFIIKSIYFYFLAIKISIIKFIKKIYFSTNFYNNFLITRTPQQFYFHPNSFFLSIITSYKKYSFKMSEIDPNLFWIKSKHRKEENELHNFFWLNLIDRKNDGKSIQKIINLWMLKYSKYKKNIWENSILSKRIISWILNADIILNSGFFDFKRKFLTSIILQTNHLKKNIKYENDYTKKIEILVAILLTGLVFKEYEQNYNLALKELEKLIKKFFDKEGFPLNRNPSDLTFCTRYFVLSKECIKDAQKYVPEFLDEIITKNFNCIKKIRLKYEIVYKSNDSLFKINLKNWGKMAKYLVETYYTCTFKVNHYLDEINEVELKNLEKRDDGKFEVLDVKLDNRKTKNLDPNNKIVDKKID